VAARNDRLKQQGHHSAKEFAERLNRAIAEGCVLRTLGEEVE
jgi:HPr kinase/phosphorylase